MQATIAEHLWTKFPELTDDIIDLDLEAQIWAMEPIGSIIYAQIDLPETGPRIQLWQETIDDIENRHSDLLDGVDRTDWLYEDVYQASQLYHSEFWAQERQSPADTRYWHFPERDDQLARSSSLLKELLASS